MKLLPQRFRALTQSGFFKGASIYLAGSVLNSALPLLIIPILTRHLTEVDYGVMGTASVLTQIFSVLVSANAFGLVARSQFDNDPTHLRRIVSTGFWLNAVVAGALLILVVVSGRWLEHFTKFPGPWLPAVVALAVGSVIQGTYSGLLQARDEPVRYIVLQTIASVGNLVLSLYLVVQWHMDWRGRMWAMLAAQLVVAVVCLWSLTMRLGLLRPVFSRKALRELLDFGVPLIPHALGGWVMTMAARLFLNNLATVADTGLYSLAYNLTSPLGMVVGAAQNAYFPALCKKLSSTERVDKLRLCRMLLAVAIALPIFALLCAAAFRWILPLVVGPRFLGAGEYVTWMTLTYAAMGVYGIFSTFVVYSKRTSLMSWRADFLGGIVLVITCPILIRLNGPIGAAQATFISFCVTAVGAFTASREAYPMPWGAATKSLLGMRTEPTPPGR